MLLVVILDHCHCPGWEHPLQIASRKQNEVAVHVQQQADQLAAAAQ